MNKMISTVRSAARTAVVAAVLGTASVAALASPALAQSPQFSFQLDLGAGSVEFRSGGKEHDKDRDRKWHRDRDRACLSDRHIRSALRDEGWRDIDFTRELRRDRVEIVARYGKHHYLLRADRCSGDVRIIERLRRGNGFGLQFKF